MEKPKICIGVPYYGGIFGEWWVQFAQHMVGLHESVELVDILAIGAMATDHNRNTIVREFLKRDAEWLFWIDSDTIVPQGAISRLLATGKTLVSGLYYGKNEPNPPIAYYVYNGAYRPIDKQAKWEVGDILPVDAVGMGCMLTHRSVFEDIQKNFIILQEHGGALTAVHNDDMIGDAPLNAKHKMDGKVIGGQQRTRLFPPTIENPLFPYFALEHGKTEDLWFFEIASRVGHKPFLDTSVECIHLRVNGFSGKDYRNVYGH